MPQHASRGPYGTALGRNYVYVGVSSRAARAGDRAPGSATAGRTPPERAPPCGWSAGRFATSCSEGPRSISIWWSKATRGARDLARVARSGSHDRFGTSTVTLDGFTLRHRPHAARGVRARPERCPMSRPATLAEDLVRRDFTVNAIALALAGDTAGELTAVPGALEDLDARRLRVLHDRELHRRPHAPVPARPLRRAGWVRDRAQHARARGPRDRRAARCARSAARGSARSSGCSRASPTRSRRSRPRASSSSSTRHPSRLRPRRRGPRAGARWRSFRTTGGAIGSRSRWRRSRRAGSELTALLDSLGFEAEDRDAIVLAASRAGQVASAFEAAGAPSEIATAARWSAGGAGRTGGRARRRAPGPGMAGPATPRPPGDRWPRPARRRRARRPRDRARTARRARAKLDRRASGASGSSPRRSARLRRVADVAAARGACCYKSDDEVAGAVLRLGRARGDRPARRAGGVHDPARRILRGPVREPQPGPPDRRPPGGGPAATGAGCRSVRGQAGARPPGPRHVGADRHGPGRPVRRAAARGGNRVARGRRPGDAGCAAWRRWC